MNNGADSSIADNAGHTPFHYASLSYGGGFTFDILIKHGVNINARDKAGRTALQWAERYGKWDVANRLRDHGAVAGAE